MEETTSLPLSIEPREIVYRDRHQSTQRIVARFDGFVKEYYVSDHGQRAAVLAVRDGQVLFVRQYRLLINGLSYEIPGGRIEETEAPEAAAIRECLEETGVECSQLKLLLTYHPSLDIWKNFTHIFCSSNCHDTSESKSDRRVWIPLGRSIEMIFGSEIVESLSIIALLAYHATLEKR